MLNGLCKTPKVARSKNYLYKYEVIIFSNNFERRGKIVIGLYVHLSVGSFFLWTGTIFYSLRESGNFPDEIVINAGIQIFKSKSTFIQNFDRNLSSSSFI